MKFLVSPRDAREAIEAISGGADIIDIKNPREGSLGANFPWAIKEIVSLRKGSMEFSATVGDLPNLPGTASLAALGAASCGVDYVKAGLYGVKDAKEASFMCDAVVKAVKGFDRNIKVVIAGYADYLNVGSISPKELPEIASRTKADYVMIDTARKDGRTLLDHMDEADLRDFTKKAHDKGLKVALGGSLDKTHVQMLKKIGVDVLGVRGAVCDGDRMNGSISAVKVRELRKLVAGD
ncbi:MAG: (5-formylfuran-3-yl)methyl phosphate synthase [Candidatus Altiarchaeota archaeon]|nr:(5-formylfuran-3-yl)methyl phosphate synthase [Candidatus Altiarchaeota archaeon]